VVPRETAQVEPHDHGAHYHDHWLVALERLRLTKV
jgi:hypothetical protein